MDYGFENKPILHLNLKSKWFDMILAQTKREEYRDIKPYWERVFQQIGTEMMICIKGVNYRPEDVVICFSNGYSKVRRQIYVECEYLINSLGIEEWGAGNEIKYTLGLGKILLFKDEHIILKP